MRILQDGTDVDGFFDELARVGNGVLLLDYDGTLAPFEEDRDAAVPYEGVRGRLETLRRLAGKGGSVSSPIVISGRPSEEVDRLLAVDPPPEIWGCHGWERRDADGELHAIDPGEGVRGGLDRAYAAAGDVAPEERLEHKGAAVAVHFRGMDEGEAESLQAEVRAHWRSIVDDGEGLELRPFDGGLELRAGARDKGSAVEEILADTPSGLPLAYLGDDLTDEDAFGAVRAVGGLAVLVRPVCRETEANIWIHPPDELLAFLDRWIAALSRGTAFGSDPEATAR